MLPLFDDPHPPLASALAPRLRQLAAERIYYGTTSWKYEGWLGQIYTQERYLTRGKFSQKKFEAECLDEYAQTFPAVCGDFSFYQFPSQAHWQRLFASAPSQLRYAFKVPEDITVKRFPVHARYGARAGLLNETFLNPALLRDAFLAPLEIYQERIVTLILEFGAFSRDAFSGERSFPVQLDAFLGALPKTFRYSVEVRNPEFLDSEYFSCLRSHGVAHVFNAWTRMPELAIQMALRDAYTADFQVVRALLRHGRTYEDANARFAPYSHLRDPYPAAREAIRKLAARSREQRQPSYIFVNNCLEGCAPQSVAAIVAD